MAPPKLALLIDAENVAFTACGAILDQARLWGDPVLRRAYGDWSRPGMVGWREGALSHGFLAVQQFSYACGKGAADAALIVEAMDLLHGGGFAAFLIVSSDSDFARLALRIRESGAKAYGMGEAKAPAGFRAVFDEFRLLGAGAAPSPAAKAPLAPRVLARLREAYAETREGEKGASLAKLGQALRAGAAPLDAKALGHAKFSGLLLASGLFELEIGEGASWARLKAEP